MNQVSTPSNNLPAKAEPKTFRDLLVSDSYKAALSGALPKHVTVDRMVRVVLTAMNRTPKLLACTKESLWQSVMDCASLGLEPDALGRAYLIPYEDKKNNRTICQLQIGYKGLADLAYRSGMVESIQAQAVHEKDHFELAFGSNEKLDHKPYMDGDRGKVVAVYAYCKLKGGAFKFDVMSVRDVEVIRARSKSGNNGPWATDWNEMAKKTVFKRMAKTLPLSSEIRSAIELDDAANPVEAVAGASLADRFSQDTATDATMTTAEVVNETAPAAAQALGA